ncbi:MAG: 30S ribosomal protein S18 [Anaerolineae bacterium]|nr:30S ribosomal protein S18 [Anaerolineae bacterium]
MPFPKDLSLVDYKNVDFLQRFLNESGQIKPRRKTGASTKQQRILARAIKRARHLALLPYTGHQARG